MKRAMRRADRAISKDEAGGLLRRGEYGVLSTVSGDGQPYGVPVSYSYTEDGIYFHCAVEGHKLENVTANSKVAFCVVGKTEVLPAQFGTRYESVIVFGTVSEAAGEEKQRGLVALLEKYSPGFMAEGLRYIDAKADGTRVFKITIAQMTGKARR